MQEPLATQVVFVTVPRARLHRLFPLCTTVKVWEVPLGMAPLVYVPAPTLSAMRPLTLPTMST